MSENTKIPETPERIRKDSEASDSEHDPQFSPIISLPEIKVTTHEEDEIELFKLRAKLYRFDSQVDPPEWKERGTGDLKILKHNEKNKFRIVMRRDKTYKVCANHFITPQMKLIRSLSCEKSFIYNVHCDFADQETKAECFAARFSSPSNADLFKAKFEEVIEQLKSNCDLSNVKDDEEAKKEIVEDTQDEKNEAQQEDGKKDVCDTTTNEISDKLSELAVDNDKDETSGEKKFEE